MSQGNQRLKKLSKYILPTNLYIVYQHRLPESYKCIFRNCIYEMWVRMQTMITYLDIIKNLSSVLSIPRYMQICSEWIPFHNYRKKFSFSGKKLTMKKTFQQWMITFFVRKQIYLPTDFNFEKCMFTLHRS